MSVAKEIQIEEFARRVERLCDFLLNKVERNGSKDHKVLVDLKEEAANIQFDHARISSVAGLHEYMGGIITLEEKS